MAQCEPMRMDWLWNFCDCTRNGRPEQPILVKTYGSNVFIANGKTFQCETFRRLAVLSRTTSLETRVASIIFGRMSVRKETCGQRQHFSLPSY